jgi:nickel-dependent lactate racemase
MTSDLKIGVASILPHPIASFSGGSKIITPGVCGSETIRYLHDYMSHYHHNYFRNPGKRAELGINPFRREIESITAIIGLDFSVNALLNHCRKICDLFAGNRIDSYYHGTLSARQLYSVNYKKEADVIIANTYPFDTSLRYMLRGLWPLIETGSRSIKVVVGAGDQGVGEMKMVNPLRFIRFRLVNRMKILRPRFLRHDFRVGLNALKNIVAQKRINYLFLSPGVKDDAFRATFPKSKRYNKWKKLLIDLEHLLAKKDSAKVAVYPCAPLQIPAERSI